MSKIKEYKKFYEQSVTWSEEDQLFIVRFPELPGCTTHGETREEAAKMAEDALESHLKALESVEKKLPVPLALMKEKKFPLRLKPDLYREAKSDADREGVSFNQHVAKALDAWHKVHVNGVKVQRSNPSRRMAGSIRGSPMKPKPPARSTRKRV